MFDRLVVSTTEHRRDRTARFFLATLIIYMVVAAGAIIVSVAVQDPRLAETGVDLRSMLAGIPPMLGRSESRPSSAAVAPRQNLNKVATLEEILRNNASSETVTTRPIGPPSIGLPGRPDGITGGTGDPNAWETGTGDLKIGAADNIIEPPPVPVAESKQPQKQPAEQRKTLIRVTSSVLQGKAIERRTPAYPQAARALRLEGSVAVELIVSPEGRVESARAISGHHLLAPAAVEAARGWRFQPTLLNGSPVRVTAVITFNFKLN